MRADPRDARPTAQIPEPASRSERWYHLVDFSTRASAVLLYAGDRSPCGSARREPSVRLPVVWVTPRSRVRRRSEARHTVESRGSCLLQHERLFLPLAPPAAGAWVFSSESEVALQQARSSDIGSSDFGILGFWGCGLVPWTDKLNDRRGPRQCSMFI